MRRGTQVLAAGFVMWVASLNGVGEAQTHTLTVRLRNEARVADEVVAASQASVTKIYALAGIDVVWVPSAAHLTVFIIERTREQRMHQEKGAMGYAALSAEGGRLAYVFDHRVREVSRGYGTEKAVVLAAALAHEIGHLLLPHPSHNATGLMRATWNESDFRNARRGQLLFTAKQGRLIREKLAIRQ